MGLADVRISDANLGAKIEELGALDVRAVQAVSRQCLGLYLIPHVLGPAMRPSRSEVLYVVIEVQIVIAAMAIP